MVSAAGDSYDFLLVTRFDLVYRQPVHRLLKFEQVNLCFREDIHIPSTVGVSDIMFGIPWSCLPGFIKCVELNGDWMHGMYVWLVKQFGEVHFMIDGTYTSNATFTHNFNALFYIYRTVCSQNYDRARGEADVVRVYNQLLQRDPSAIEKDRIVSDLVNDKTTLHCIKRQLLGIKEFTDKHAGLIHSLDSLYMELLGEPIHPHTRCTDLEHLASGSDSLKNVQLRLYDHGAYGTLRRVYLEKIYKRIKISKPEEKHIVHEMAERMRRGELLEGDIAGEFACLQALG